MMVERTDVLRNLNANVANIANRQGNANRPPRSRYMLWAELLGMKVEELEEATAERITLHIDHIVLDAKRGVWEPPQ